MEGTFDRHFVMLMTSYSGLDCPFAFCDNFSAVRIWSKCDRSGAHSYYSNRHISEQVIKTGVAVGMLLLCEVDLVGSFQLLNDKYQIIDRWNLPRASHSRCSSTNKCSFSAAVTQELLDAREDGCVGGEEEGRCKVETLLPACFDERFRFH